MKALASSLGAVLVLGACSGGADLSWVSGRADDAFVASTGGDSKQGARLIREKGCGTCHTIPGIGGASGTVGPPLFFFSRRTYIAGELPNTPANLVRWVMDPPAVEPGTAMPKLGLNEQQARDVAAYLYTLR